MDQWNSWFEGRLDPGDKAAGQFSSRSEGATPPMDLPDLEAEFDRAIAAVQFGSLENGQALYSEQVLDHAIRPRHVGRLARADAFAVVDGLCGDRMEFYLQVAAGAVDAISFTTDGCGPTIACGSMLSTMVLGQSLDEAGAVEPAELTTALGGLPEASGHCAELAVNTLRQAIFNCRAEQGARTGLCDY